MASMNDLTETSKTPVWFKAVLVAGMLLFGFYASTHMVAAGDTWVAMACGRHFAHHGVDTNEPFSFNSHKAGPTDEALTKAGWPDWTHKIIRVVHPTGWINQNWLTHLGYYKLATWFDGEGHYAWNTLVYWKFALYFITVLLVYAAGRVLGVPPLLAAAGACLAMVVGRTFYDIRPAGYSNMLVPAFILILALTMCRNFRWIWLLVPVVVFWANVHGGYIYAFIMLAPFTGINLLLRLPKRWSLCLGFAGLWGVLYLLSHQFITNEYYLNVQRLLTRGDVEAVSLIGNKMFGILVFLIAVSVVLTLLKTIPDGLFYFYHFGVHVIWFLSLFIGRFLPGQPPNLTTQYKNLYSYFVSSSQLTFLFVFIVGGLLVSAMAFKKERFTSLSLRGIYHTIGAGAVALIAMVILNPFHLTNLTHTFEISVSKHAESWRQVNEWKPAFDWMDKTTTTPNPVGEEEWFRNMCILTLVVFVAWMIIYFLKPRLNRNPAKKRTGPAAEPEDTYTWPKIDLALIVISFLTIYMAIRSRRFIAIAGSAAAPILALLIYQVWQMTAAKIHFKKTGRLAAQQVPTISCHIVRIIAAAAFAGFAVFWGLKYKRIYLDPWPTDAKYNSVFMRMTASHLKPIEACEFIRLNKLSGRIFNYWTEGGAVALGQDPDPETGQIPLKLFMDGRAQAAYNHDKFQLWQTIFSGGPIAQEAKMRGQKLTDEKYRQIADWINEELEKRNVWVTLMPVSQEDSTFMEALKVSGLWKTAYIDDIQHLLVNIQSSRGQALIEQILGGKALFPNEYTKDLTTFTVITENAVSDRYAELYKLATEAFELNPSPTAAIMLLKLRGAPAVRNDIARYLSDFVNKKDASKKEAGYLQRLGTAVICAQFLAGENPNEKQQYTMLAQQFKRESKAIESQQIW